MPTPLIPTAQASPSPAASRRRARRRPSHLALVDSSAPPSPAFLPPPSPSTLGPTPTLAPTVASLLPEHFAPEHDVHWELTHNRDAYQGRDWLSLTAFPLDLLSAVEALRDLVRHPNRPGLSPTLACCIARGVALLDDDPSVRAFIHVRKRLLDLRNDHATSARPAQFDALNEPITILLTGFETPYPSPLGNVRRNLTLPPAIASSLTELAQQLAIPSSTVAIYAIAAALAEQSHLLSPSYIEPTSTAVAAFTSRALDRAATLRCLLAAVESDEDWAERALEESSEAESGQ